MMKTTHDKDINLVLRLRQQALNDAILAVDLLSRHLAEMKDNDALYLANQALWKLWKIEKGEP